MAKPRRPSPRPRAPAGRSAAPSRDPAPETPGTEKSASPLVVVGASAGGIEALQKLLKTLPREFPAPVLIVLHRDPKHASAIVPILQRHTALRVKEAEHGEPLRAGVAYLAPKGRHLQVTRHGVRLTRAPPVHFSRPSVDPLFESAAQEFGEHVIAVVLSGSGSDGAAGVRAVKAAGGLAVVQSPREAAHGDMPQAAIKSGAVAAVLPLDRIGAFLARAVQLDGHDRDDPSPKGWAQLLDAMHRRFGIDFSGYRSNTLKRRFRKRLLATGQRDVEGYLRYLDDHPRELAELQSAFLIKVSAFFRDPVAWRELEKKVLRPLARGWQPRQEVRVWCTGCATGEEAYSLAIALLEALPAKAHDALKVFATDLDEEALATAREGVYAPTQVENVSRARLRAHFTAEGRQVRVNKSVRRRVIFGRHDVTRDPPITGLDLLSCRNLLIYLDADDKAKVMDHFSYAVKPDGHLFLGKSEGVPPGDRAFRLVSPAGHFYLRTATHQLPRAQPPAPAAARPAPPRPKGLAAEIQAGRREVDVQQAFQHLLLATTAVVVVGLDAERRVTMWNRAAAELFRVKPEVALGRSILELAEGLSADRLLKGIRDATTSMGAVLVRDVSYEGPKGDERWLDLELSPIVGRGVPDGAVLVVAVDATARHQADTRQRELAQQLRKSLTDASRANEELAEANEELETLNEELQSTAEEQQTLNEEMQSRNEELETVNEELQSANEELTTLGEEVRLRSEEVERTTLLLRTLLDLSDEIVIACDDTNRILVWSPTGRRLFHLSEQQAVGQDVFQLVPALDVPPVREAIRRAMRHRPSTAKVANATLADGRTRIGVTVSSGPRADRPAAFGYIVRIETLGSTNGERPSADSPATAPAPPTVRPGSRDGGKRPPRAARGLRRT